jgi:hypothetical protein
MKKCTRLQEQVDERPDAEDDGADPDGQAAVTLQKIPTNCQNEYNRQ